MYGTVIGEHDGMVSANSLPNSPAFFDYHKTLFSKDDEQTDQTTQTDKKLAGQNSAVQNLNTDAAQNVNTDAGQNLDSDNIQIVVEKDPKKPVLSSMRRNNQARLALVHGQNLRGEYMDYDMRGAGVKCTCDSEKAGDEEVRCCVCVCVCV